MDREMVKIIVEGVFLAFLMYLFLSVALCY